jgi:CDP-6-deoxy-D-xylo-4-hexulose-3-dehydrase
LAGLTDDLILPEAQENSAPSWFGFAITLKQASRQELIAFLESRKIASRLLFGGNLTKQPYFAGQSFRVIGELTNTDTVMNQTLWLGVFPGLNTEMIDYIIDSINAFFGKSI